MLGKLWLFISVILVIAGLVFDQVAILMLAVLFFLTGGIARLWDKNSLKRVSYRRKLSSERVFFGETLDLEIEIANRKPLPLPWLQVDDELPMDVTLLKGKTDVSYLPMNVVLNNLLSIGWYHKITRHYPLQCARRGFFTFGPATVRTGDIFGFFQRQQEIPELDHLTVYPRILPLNNLLAPSNQPVGEIRIKSHLFQDPLLMQGVREYRYGDSLRRIHWKNTARRGELQTRIFEATTTVDLSIFLDVRTVDVPHWGSSPDKLELAIITAVAIANDALSRGYRVGLYVNQYKHGTGTLIRIPPNRSPVQFRQILEALAPVQEIEALSMHRFLVNESRHLPWGNAITLVSAAPSEELHTVMLKLKRAGRKMSLVKVGGEAVSNLGHGIPVHHVSDTVSWRDIETVEVY